MKTIILLFVFISCAFSQYTFLVNEYDKEIDLEAKIIAKIAKSSIKDEIRLFIPDISEMEKKVYSRYFIVTDNCDSSNFIFIKKSVGDKMLCAQAGKLFFTNNYKKLLSDDKYIGAFFWNKSRPNIVFIKSRLENQHIELPKSYEQFVEDF
ncbi:MAG: hypothetical protein ACNI3C_08990 [Candidatus Marinarcus sp.]|uniref:hypothetical protein n=1 Tax=Candidatus Marinarcus sp. TaxID=3100987 RepID=UPI003B00A940